MARPARTRWAVTNLACCPLRQRLRLRLLTAGEPRLANYRRRGASERLRAPAGGVLRRRLRAASSRKLSKSMLWFEVMINEIEEQTLAIRKMMDRTLNQNYRRISIVERQYTQRWFQSELIQILDNISPLIICPRKIKEVLRISKA
uniref:Uncharacterized protein n=1 Tax=Oryza nivara TaxID=4536 RepID=A0A0E0HFT3_ORYNI